MLRKDSPHTCLHAGFTLLELLTILLLLAIVAAVAVPGWQRLMADNRLNVTANTLVLSLQRARSEALKRNAVVFVCAGDGHTGCRDPGDWSQGWLISIDADSNGRADRDEPVISESSIQGNTVVRASRRSANVAFRYDGRSPGSNTTWILCDPRGSARPRQIVLSNEGRIRTAHGDQAQDCS